MSVYNLCMYACMGLLPLRILSNKELRHLLEISTAVSEVFTDSIALSDAEMCRFTEWYWLLLVVLLIVLLLMLVIVGLWWWPMYVVAVAGLDHWDRLSAALSPRRQDISLVYVCGAMLLLVMSALLAYPDKVRYAPSLVWCMYVCIIHWVCMYVWIMYTYVWIL